MKISAVVLAMLLLVLGARGGQAQAWAAVDVGQDHVCALDSGGRAFCWGGNHHGELGMRTRMTCGPSHHGGRPACWASRKAVPVPVSGGMRFRALSSGGTRSCGLDDRGRAWCWGGGIGTTAAGCAGGTACSFVPVPFAPETEFRALRVGEDAVCGITTDGAGRCWRPAWPRGGWVMTEVAPGERLAWIDHHGDWMDRDHYVACGVTGDGRALCQGENAFAQLGAGDTLPHAGAVRVAGTAAFAQVRPGALWTCGLARDGRAFCWGAAEARPSWPGGAPSRPGYFACRTSAWCSAPRPVAEGLRFSTITPVRHRFCGLARDGRVHCWGQDGAAVPVADGLRFVALEGGETRACGVAREGQIWCWRAEGWTDVVRPVRAPPPPRPPR
ncbi:MAG TPA: hypothetical protein VFQ45_08530 [Longimicrobium sp.]|nr:hypothetical protein [Longimicrobium sp.]